MPTVCQLVYNIHIVPTPIDKARDYASPAGKQQQQISDLACHLIFHRLSPFNCCLTSFCSFIKGITSKICRLYYVLINSGVFLVCFLTFYVYVFTGWVCLQSVCLPRRYSLCKYTAYVNSLSHVGHLIYNFIDTDGQRVWMTACRCCDF